MNIYSQTAWLIPLFPLAAFLVLTALGRSYRRAGVFIGSLGSFGAFVLSLFIMIDRLGTNEVDYNYAFNWIALGICIRLCNCRFNNGAVSGRLARASAIS